MSRFCLIILLYAFKSSRFSSANLKKISNMFYNCNNLTDVYYGGTSDAWNAITINSGNGVLTSATIHYNG